MRGGESAQLFKHIILPNHFTVRHFTSLTSLLPPHLTPPTTYRRTDNQARSPDSDKHISHGSYRTASSYGDVQLLSQRCVRSRYDRGVSHVRRTVEKIDTSSSLPLSRHLLASVTLLSLHNSIVKLVLLYGNCVRVCADRGVYLSHSLQHC